MELITERLILRPFQETDLDDLYEFLSQRKTMSSKAIPYVYAILSREYIQCPETEMNPKERNHV